LNVEHSRGIMTSQKLSNLNK